MASVLIQKKKQGQDLALPRTTDKRKNAPSEFLKHIETCEECREELEIYFTVDVGIRQLDQETGTYNIKGALETALELSRQRVHTLGILETARYAVNTLCFWAVLAVLVLQFRMW